MKLRTAKKIADIELNGHHNYRWFLKNKRGVEVSPWSLATRQEAMKRLSKTRN